MKCLEGIIASRRRNPIKIRLLMTTGCVEYWFLLHYERVRPAIATPAEKERVRKDVQRHVLSFEKGAQKSTDEIAQHYARAVENGRWTLECLKQEGMPEGSVGDRWLYQGKHTFTTVHEAIEMLMEQASGGA